MVTVTEPGISPTDCLLEDKAQEEKAGSDMGSGSWLWLTEIRQHQGMGGPGRGGLLGLSQTMQMRLVRSLNKGSAWGKPCLPLKEMRDAAVHPQVPGLTPPPTPTPSSPGPEKSMSRSLEWCLT